MDRLVCTARPVPAPNVRPSKPYGIELDEDAWERRYGFRLHPIQTRKGRQVAVRVISQFGEESTRVLTL